MSDLEKINIYLPNEICKILEYDAEMFEFFKKDGKNINMNRFLSMMIMGYYNNYATECINLRKKIENELNCINITEHNRIVLSESILRNVCLPQIPVKKAKKQAKLSLKPTRKTESLIIKIMQDIGGYESISHFFCSMFIKYC
nr:hypothetical protein [Lachnospiraceae bacterium]